MSVALLQHPFYATGTKSVFMCSIFLRTGIATKLHFLAVPSSLRDCAATVWLCKNVEYDLFLNSCCYTVVAFFVSKNDQKKKGLIEPNQTSTRCSGTYFNLLSFGEIHYP